jgi:hypothetical protein
MRIIFTEIGVERELRRRGWSQAAHALRRRREGWYVRDGNEFLVCSGHRLSWYKVETKDNPWNLYPFKLYLGRPCEPVAGIQEWPYGQGDSPGRSVRKGPGEELTGITVAPEAREVTPAAASLAWGDGQAARI